MVVWVSNCPSVVRVLVRVEKLVLLLVVVNVLEDDGVSVGASVIVSVAVVVGSVVVGDSVTVLVELVSTLTAVVEVVIVVSGAELVVGSVGVASWLVGVDVGWGAGVLGVELGSPLGAELGSSLEVAGLGSLLGEELVCSFEVGPGSALIVVIGGSGAVELGIGLVSLLVVNCTVVGEIDKDDCCVVMDVLAVEVISPVGVGVNMSVGVVGGGSVVVGGGSVVVGGCSRFD